jgi:hypothetical protein
LVFDDYCSAVWKANNELNCCNANIDPKSQVTVFLQDIKADARTNPQLLAVKAIIVKNEETNSGLFHAINSFNDTMRQVTGMCTGRLDQGQVGAVHAGNQGNPHGGRGRGQGRSRGSSGRNQWHRGGRGGRQGGRNNSQNDQENDQNQMYIPRDVMESLDSQQQRWIIQGRNLEQEQDMATPNRNASAVGSQEPAGTDDNTTNTSTIRTERTVQFEEEDCGVSGLFGYNGRKK